MTDTINDVYNKNNVKLNLNVHNLALLQLQGEEIILPDTIEGIQDRFDELCVGFVNTRLTEAEDLTTDKEEKEEEEEDEEEENMTNAGCTPVSDTTR